MDGFLEFPSHTYLHPPSNGGGMRASSDSVSAAHGDGQPQFAAAQLALVDFFSDLNLRPHVTIGRRLGELIAAATGGILEEQQALHFLAQLSSDLHSSPSAGTNGALSARLATLRVSPPRIPVVSSATAGLYPGDPTGVAKILAQACTEDLDPEKEIRSLKRTGANIFIQIGGNHMPADLAHRISGPKSADTPRVTNPFAGEGELCERLLAGLGELVVQGMPLNLSSLFGDARLTSLPGPLYPFALLLGREQVTAVRAQRRLTRSSPGSHRRSCSRTQGRRTFRGRSKRHARRRRSRWHPLG